jgi:predicted peroxiredoxin
MHIRYLTLQPQHLPMPEGKEHFEEGFKKANVPSIPELVEMAQAMGVTFYCLSDDDGYYGSGKDTFVDGIKVDGAVTFLEVAKDADVTLTF